MASGPRPQGDTTDSGTGFQPVKQAAQLGRRFRAGEEQAFRTLMEAHQDAVFRLALGLLGDEQGAEDAAQEAFVRAYQSRGRFDAGRAFGPWVRGIAIHVCRDELRRRGRQQSLLPERPPQRRDSRAAEIRAALTELPEQLRLPLTMFYIEDTTVAEIAQALRMREGTVRVRLHRGRELLRRRLLGEGDG